MSQKNRTLDPLLHPGEPVTTSFQHDGIDYRITLLTPALARELLGRNTHNRRVRKNNLALLTSAIRGGEWRYDGSPIRIDSDGNLIDGQHRCLAVIAADKPVHVLIIEGLPSEVQSTIDTGASRSLSDALTLAGEPNASVLGALIRAFWAIEKTGSIEAAFAQGGGSPRAMTVSTGLSWLEQNSWVREYATRAKSAWKYSPLTPTAATVLMAMFDRIDVADSQHFWDAVHSGANLPAGHAILALRAQLDRAGRSHERADQRHLAAMTIKAWNAYRAGAEISNLYFRRGGATPESFPEAK